MSETLSRTMDRLFDRKKAVMPERHSVIESIKISTSLRMLIFFMVLFSRFVDKFGSKL